MFEQKKSFVAVYDKDCREYAETLMTLVSNKDSLRNVNVEREEFKKNRAITSDEFVLTIGKKGTACYKQDFPDKYSSFGIHIGYYGAKAWIICDNINWTEESLAEFHKEVIAVREKLGMVTEGIVKKDRALLENKVDEQSLIVSGGMDVFVLPATNPLLAPVAAASTFKKLIDYVNNRKDFKKQQYRFAIALFYSNYLNDFLKIKEENDEEQNEEQNF